MRGGVENSKLLSIQGLVFLETSHWSRSQLGVTSLEQKTWLSPRKSKGFRNCVSGTRIMNHVLEQEMLLVLISLRKLGF